MNYNDPVHDEIKNCIICAAGSSNFCLSKIQNDPRSNKLYMVSTRLRQNPMYVSLYVFWSKFILVSNQIIKLNQMRSPEFDPKNRIFDLDSIAYVESK